jgi:hypothetical protein
MKKFLIGLGIFLLLLVIIYLSGPKPAAPRLVAAYPALTHNLTALEKEITEAERAIKIVKQDNEARIIWFDSSTKKKTPYSIVYLHGFGPARLKGRRYTRNWPDNLAAICTSPASATMG